MKRDILGVMIDDLDKRKLLSEISKRMEQKRRTVIFTPNPIMTQDAKKDPELMRILNGSDYNIPDGNGMILASRLLKTNLKERICGIELAEELLEVSARLGLRVFLLGGEEGVAKAAAVRLKKACPQLKICGTLNGFFNDNEEGISKINALRPQVVFVCLGSPKQEKWIRKNADRLPSAILFMGLGGSLDVWSGARRRAPRIMGMCGLEWLWRVLCEPRRAHIFLDIPHFLFLVLRQRAQERKKAVADQKSSATAHQDV